MSVTTTTAAAAATTGTAAPAPAPDEAAARPAHLRRVVAGLDGLIARAEADEARWAPDGRAGGGDRRSAALAARAGERLAQLRASRAAVLADAGRRDAEVAKPGVTCRGVGEG